jgi:hypothetical protein
MAICAQNSTKQRRISTAQIRKRVTFEPSLTPRSRAGQPTSSARIDTQHEFIFIPDLAETLIALSEKEEAYARRGTSLGLDRSPRGNSPSWYSLPWIRSPVSASPLSSRNLEWESQSLKVSSSELTRNEMQSDNLTPR